MKTKSSLFILSIFLVFISSCGSADNSTAISSASLYLDQEGTQPTEKYDARAIFYCIITLDQPIPDSTLRASWVAVETNRLAPNSVLKETCVRIKILKINIGDPQKKPLKTQ